MSISNVAKILINNGECQVFLDFDTYAHSILKGGGDLATYLGEKDSPLFKNFIREASDGVARLVAKESDIPYLQTLVEMERSKELIELSKSLTYKVNFEENPATIMGRLLVDGTPSQGLVRVKGLTKDNWEPNKVFLLLQVQLLLYKAAKSGQFATETIEL